MVRPTVAFIGTGGTIASIAETPLDIHDYVGGKMLSASELLAKLLPNLDFVNVRTVDLPPIISDAATPRDWFKLATIIEELERQDSGKGKDLLAGIVVGHGTASLEETAFALNLTLSVKIPVVFVGSMRPASAVSSDAGMNLLAALRVAADPSSRGRGLLVVLNDEIHAARDATKSSTSKLNAFQSRDAGPLGFVDADRVVYYRKPEQRHYPDTVFKTTYLDNLPRVDICYAYAGCDGTAVRAFIAAGARGIVSAGFAPGGTSPLETEVLREAVSKGAIVVQTTRTGSGRVLSTRAMVADGIIPGDNLTPQKARILLALALKHGADHQEITRMFEEY